MSEVLPNSSKLSKELAILRNNVARKADEDICWKRYNELLSAAKRNRYMAYAAIIAVVTGAVILDRELTQMLMHRLSTLTTR